VTPPKRKAYVRLLPSQWAELRAFWETGDHSLAELSDQYGVSPRAIQSHVSKHGSVKGSKAAEMAAVVQKEIFKEELGDRDTFVFRAKETRESAYANAKMVENLIMAQLHLAQKDPSQAFKAATALKALSLAASALERLHATKSRALGLDREDAVPDEMPVLEIRDLGAAEIAELKRRNEEDESELGNTAGSLVDDDIIVEGEESEASGELELSEVSLAPEVPVHPETVDETVATEEPAKPHTASVGPLGGRLVRGYTP
jgi:hypothetical protein